MRLVLSAHGDARPSKLFDGDKGFLEVPIFGENMRPKVERKVFGNKDMVRNFGQVY